ncbi:MAG: hypothetical protein FWG72_10315 [Oscillospiraceae bacterium]|nr:hypothetical protein [Oscillospiraceae bacterium]
MRNLKKLLALAVVLALSVSFVLPAFAKTIDDFADADAAKEVLAEKGGLSGSYTRAVQLMIDLNVIEGADPLGDGNLVLALDKDLTRAEFSVMLYKALNGGSSIQESGRNFMMAPSVFADVPEDAWYKGYANAFAVLNISAGIGPDANGNPQFGGNNRITFDQALLLCMKAIGLNTDLESGFDWDFMAVLGVGYQLDMIGNLTWGTDYSIDRATAALLLQYTIEANWIGYNTFNGVRYRRDGSTIPGTTTTSDNYRLLNNVFGYTTKTLLVAADGWRGNLLAGGAGDQGGKARLVDIYAWSDGSYKFSLPSGLGNGSVIDDLDPWILSTGLSNDLFTADDVGRIVNITFQDPGRDGRNNRNDITKLYGFEFADELLLETYKATNATRSNGASVPSLAGLSSLKTADQAFRAINFGIQNEINEGIPNKFLNISSSGDGWPVNGAGNRLRAYGIDGEVTAILVDTYYFAQVDRAGDGGYYFKSQVAEFVNDKSNAFIQSWQLDPTTGYTPAANDWVIVQHRTQGNSAWWDTVFSVRKVDSIIDTVARASSDLTSVTIAGTAYTAAAGVTRPNPTFSIGGDNRAEVWAWQGFALQIQAPGAGPTTPNKYAVVIRSFTQAANAGLDAVDVQDRNRTHQVRLLLDDGQTKDFTLSGIRAINGSSTNKHGKAISAVGDYGATTGSSSTSTISFRGSKGSGELFNVAEEIDGNIFAYTLSEDSQFVTLTEINAVNGTPPAADTYESSVEQAFARGLEELSGKTIATGEGQTVTFVKSGSGSDTKWNVYRGRTVPKITIGSSSPSIQYMLRNSKAPNNGVNDNDPAGDVVSVAFIDTGAGSVYTPTAPSNWIVALGGYATVPPYRVFAAADKDGKFEDELRGEDNASVINNDTTKKGHIYIPTYNGDGYVTGLKFADGLWLIAKGDLGMNTVGSILTGTLIGGEFVFYNGDTIFMDAESGDIISASEAATLANNDDYAAAFTWSEDENDGNIIADVVALFKGDVSTGPAERASIEVDVASITGFVDGGTLDEITVKVLDKDGDPIVDATVSVAASVGNLSGSPLAVTDAQGETEFAGYTLDKDDDETSDVITFSVTVDGFVVTKTVSVTYWQDVVLSAFGPDGADLAKVVGSGDAEKDATRVGTAGPLDGKSNFITSTGVAANTGEGSGNYRNSMRVTPANLGITVPGTYTITFNARMNTSTPAGQRNLQIQVDGAGASVSDGTWHDGFAVDTWLEFTATIEVTNVATFTRVEFQPAGSGDFIEDTVYYLNSITVVKTVYVAP